MLSLPFLKWLTCPETKDVFIIFVMAGRDSSISMRNFIGWKSNSLDINVDLDARTNLHILIDIE